jgi:hypothetical protein
MRLAAPHITLLTGDFRTLPGLIFSLLCSAAVLAEKGFNAIEYEAAVNSWIRRIRITNADAAIKLYSSSFNTVSDVQITQTRPRSGNKWVGRKDGLIADKDGHMGIALHWACFDNLVEKFNITG